MSATNGLGDLGLEDMSGLEYADDDFFGLDAIVTPEMAMEALVAALSGGAALVLAQQGISRIPLPEEWEPRTKMLVRTGIGVGAGLVVGRLVYNYNRDAAMGIVGAMVGAGVAGLVNYFLLDSAPVGFSGAEDMELMSPMTESALLGTGGGYSAMSELSAAVTTPERRSLSGPQVSPEQLMGHQGMEQYNPYMS